MAIKRIYIKKQTAMPTQGLTLAFPGTSARAKNVKLLTEWKRANVDKQPTPIKDFLNFKLMSGNEVILNLENHEHFSTSELIGGLLALSQHDRLYRFNWNNHPTTATALKDLKGRIGNMNAKNLIQTAIILDKL
jgi:hypothetical protein